MFSSCLLRPVAGGIMREINEGVRCKPPACQEVTVGKRCKKVKHTSNLGNSRFTKMNKFGKLPSLTFAYHIGGKRSWSMIYLTPERKLGRVIIAIWTGPIMPSLNCHVCTSSENHWKPMSVIVCPLCPLHVSYWRSRDSDGLGLTALNTLKRFPDSSHLQMHASQPTAPMTGHDWTGNSNRNL